MLDRDKAAQLLPRLLSFRVTFQAMMLEDRASGYLLCPLPIAAGFLSALFNVLIHALFLAANAV
jgi:hypothetical protein